MGSQTTKKGPTADPTREVAVAFRTSKEAAMELAELCAEHGVNRSDVLRDAVALGLPRLKKKRGWR